MNQALTLTRPLVAFDLETTGLDIENDRIVEISAVKIHADGRRETRTHRVNPQMPINPSAARVHGISDADVANAPTFDQLAQELRLFFDGSDLTGFNVERFDLPLLTREFKRVNLTFPPGPVNVIDSWTIFLRKEPRDLTAAYRFYCNKTLEHAHSAEADAQAAADILMAQVGRYEDLPRAVPELHAFCHTKNPDWIDPAGKLAWREDKAVLTFGKYKNRPLQQLASEDPEYLKWIANADFSEQVVQIARAALTGEFPERVAASAP